MNKKGGESGTQSGLWLIGIGVLSILVGIFTERIIFMGICFLCIGAGVLYMVWEGMAAVKSAAIVEGVYFVVLGILISITDVIQDRYGTGGIYSAFVVGLGIGILLIGVSIFNVVKRFLCNIRVEGTYLGANRQQSKSVVQYVPRFSFSYEGKQYENTSGETYSKKKIHKKYEVGGKYPIFISAKRPNMFRTKMGVQIGDVMMIVLGLAFCLVPFFMLK